MATLKGQTIAASYQDLVKRADTYSQTGTNIEIMNDSAVVQPTGLYLESGATTDNVGIGVADPDATLEILDTTTQLKLSYDATNYATFNIAADGLLTITTVDPDGAEADIILAPDGNVGIGIASPTKSLDVRGDTYLLDNAARMAAYIQNDHTSGNGLMIGTLGTSADQYILNCYYGNNASNVALRVGNDGNVGIGCTPETYHGDVNALQLKNGGLVTENSVGASKSITLAYNQYVDSGNAWTYINADEASY